MSQIYHDQHYMGNSIPGHLVLNENGSLVDQSTYIQFTGAKVTTSQNKTVVAIDDSGSSGGMNLLLGTYLAAETSDVSTVWIPYQMIDVYKNLGLKVNNYICISFDWEATDAPAEAVVKVGTSVSPSDYFGEVLTLEAGNSSGHVSKNFKITNALASSNGSDLAITFENATGMTFSISKVKLELSKAESSWCPSELDGLRSTQSIDSNEKLYIVGAKNQGNYSPTYSQDTAYVGTDGHVYSNDKQVVNLSDTQALTNKTYEGYTLNEACEKEIDTEVTENSENLITSGAVYAAIYTSIDQVLSASY